MGGWCFTRQPFSIVWIPGSVSLRARGIITCQSSAALIRKEGGAEVGVGWGGATVDEKSYQTSPTTLVVLTAGGSLWWCLLNTELLLRL